MRFNVKKFKCVVSMRNMKIYYFVRRKWNIKNIFKKNSIFKPKLLSKGRFFAGFCFDESFLNKFY